MINKPYFTIFSKGVIILITFIVGFIIGCILTFVFFYFFFSKFVLKTNNLAKVVKDFGLDLDFFGSDSNEK